tara:strand:+ start:396 stop:1430 length:1035 start_codon:yes stop_codon:yes gene_type:complete
MNFLDFIIPDKFIYTQEQLESMRWEKLQELRLGIYNPGFLIIIWISQHIGLDVLGLNLLCASVFMFGLHKLCKTQPYPWLAYVVAFPYLITVVAMGYVKQSFVIGIAFWCFSIWQKSEKYHEIKIIILALIGITFHKISLFILPLIFIRNRGKFFNYYFILIGLLVLIIILYYLSLIQTIPLYIEHYIIKSNIHKYGENPSVTISYGVMTRMLMNIPPCLLLIYFYRNFKEFGDRRLWTLISFFSIIAFLASSYASTFIDRLGLYLISLQIVVYSRIPLFINNVNVRKLFIYAICIFYFSVFFVWLNYSDSSWAWIPYKINLLQVTYPITYYFSPLVIPNMEQF